MSTPALAATRPCTANWSLKPTSPITAPDSGARRWAPTDHRTGQGFQPLDPDEVRVVRAADHLVGHARVADVAGRGRRGDGRVPLQERADPAVQRLAEGAGDRAGVLGDEDAALRVRD